MKALRLGGICSDFSCAKCCYETAMLLSEKDIELIETLDYIESEFSITNENGLKQIRNIEGVCFFLKDNKCIIYTQRPQGCRFYPIIFDLDLNRAVLDDECPLSKTISDKIVSNFAKDLKKFVKNLLKDKEI